MQTFSKYFNLDVIDTNQVLKPVLVITQTFEESSIPIPELPLFTLTLDQEELFDTSGRIIQSINSIQKVSNVKSSNDYDSKKLKINTLRCTLYNYYDSKSRLSEYINTGIINKNIYLFYKSPTTNVINLDEDISDYDCGLIYSGKISRIKFNDKTLELTAEDQTQIKIADKNVPYMSVDRLEKNISDNILKKYKNDDNVVPMTFGKVDKAPMLPYYENTNNRVINYLIDIQPTYTHHKTSKIPSMLDGNANTPFDDYYLYIKDSNDYLIYDHSDYTIPEQYKHYSTFRVVSVTGYSNNNIIPSIGSEQNSGIFKLWDSKAFSQRMVDTAYASDGSILDITNINEVSLNNNTFDNISSVYNNNNYNKKWYRPTDYILSSHLNFDTGIRQYIQGVDPTGSGRWIILKLDEGSDNNLYNLQQNGNFIGNTFLMSDYQIYQDTDLVSTPNLTSTGASTGFMVAPIVPELWNEFIKANSFSDENWKIIKLVTMLFQKRKQFEDAMDLLDENLTSSEILAAILSIGNDDGWINETDMQNASDWSHSVIELLPENATSGDSSYWGSFGQNNNLNDTQQLKKIQGMFYGDKGDLNNILIDAPANEFDHIAIFEHTVDKSADYRYQSGLKMNNCAFLQSILVEGVNEKEIYASITGRRNHLFTEELDVQNFNMFPQGEGLDIEEIPLDFYFNGLDGNVPDLDLLTNEIMDIVEQVRNDFMSGVYWTREEASNFVNGNIWENSLQANWEGSISDDSPIANSYIFFKEFIWKPILNNLKIYYSMGAEFDGASLDTSFEDINTNFVPYTGNNSSSGVDSENFNTGDGFTGGYRFTIRSYRNGSGVADGTGLLGPDHIEPRYKNYRELLSGYFTKSYIKDILRYLYQSNDITYYDNEYKIQYDTLEFSHYVYNWQHTKYFFGIREKDYYLKDEINSYRNYLDIPFENVETLQDWINNFYLYMDDLTQAIATTFMNNQVEQSNLAYNSFVGVQYILTQYGDDEHDVPVFYGYSEHFLYNFLIDNSSMNMNQWANINPFVLGLGHTDPSNALLEQIVFDFIYIANNNLEPEEDPLAYLSTDGIIQKPSDIVMNILVNEMEFGNYKDPSPFAEDNTIGSVIPPDYNSFDIESINSSRNAHNNWQMGFSVDRKKDGKKLIEEILKESKSYPMFTSDGKFSLITIKEKYTYDDISMIIDEQNIIKYTFNQTKREDIITSLKMFYRYDYGFKKYDLDLEKNITDLLPEYDGFNYYNISSVDSHKDVDLKYHTDSNTVNNFLDYTLLNGCNPHNEVVLELPLKYINLTVGDVIHLPLINNEKIFNLDYSKVEILNGQPIYPLWIILATDISSKSIKVKAYQLHYLGVDGDHGFVLPDESYEIVGNMKQFNSTQTLPNGEPLRNWNYNPNATIDSGIEIPYFDLNGDGNIDIIDVQTVFNAILGNEQLTSNQMKRLRLPEYGNINADPNVVNVVDGVNIVNFITGVVYD